MEKVVECKISSKSRRQERGRKGETEVRKERVREAEWARQRDGQTHQVVGIITMESAQAVKQATRGEEELNTWLWCCGVVVE